MATKLHNGKTKINWMEDAYGKQSCHLNTSGMAKDTYVGHIFHRDGHWWSYLKDGTETKHPSMKLARKHVQDSVNGEPIDVWD